ncbi:MAG: hypothetical protein P8170_13180 [Gemmatimonadota bacterium]|jgi:hypothetical protein
MKLRTARALVGAYLLVALIAVTWPGLVPFARIRPLVFGLPFAFFWVAAWIAGVMPVLYALDRVERRHRPRGDA